MYRHEKHLFIGIRDRAQCSAHGQFKVIGDHRNSIAENSSATRKEEVFTDFQAVSDECSMRVAELFSAIEA